MDDEGEIVEDGFIGKVGKVGKEDIENKSKQENKNLQ
jgi:hypothetical protein